MARRCADEGPFRRPADAACALLAHETGAGASLSSSVQVAWSTVPFTGSPWAAWSADTDWAVGVVLAGRADLRARGDQVLLRPDHDVALRARLQQRIAQRQHGRRDAGRAGRWRSSRSGWPTATTTSSRRGAVARGQRPEALHVPFAEGPL